MAASTRDEDMVNHEDIDMSSQNGHLPEDDEEEVSEVEDDEDSAARESLDEEDITDRSKESLNSFLGNIDEDI